MEKLVEGLKKFQTEVFGAKRELFTKLSQGQEPRALFITCSDSRVDPTLLTQAKPGERFILRNAGNIVPSYGGGVIGGNTATIEYAVTVRLRRGGLTLHGWVYSTSTGDIWAYDEGKGLFESLSGAAT